MTGGADWPLLLALAVFVGMSLVREFMADGDWWLATLAIVLFIAGLGASLFMELSRMANV